MADLGEILRVVGAGVRDINRPGTLAEALLAEQKRRGAEELRSLAGQQFGAQPITSPQQQPTAGAPNANIAQLAQLAAQGIPGADLILRDALSRRGGSFEEQKIEIERARNQRLQRQEERLSRQADITEKLMSSLLSNEAGSVKEASEEAKLNNREKISQLMQENRNLRGLTLSPETKDFAITGIEQNNSEIKRLRDLEKTRGFTLKSINKQQDDTDRVLTAIDTALNQANFMTSGVVGALTQDLPSAQARDLKATLGTIVAHLGLGTLQEIKDASPTGAALGQLSDTEMAILQRVKANLEQSQSPEQLRRNLLIAKDEVKKSLNRIKSAYARDYGDSDSGNINIGQQDPFATSQEGGESTEDILARIEQSLAQRG